MKGKRMKNNSYRKQTFLDHFIKAYCCSGHNHPEGYRWWKKKCSKDFRRRDKGTIRKELRDYEEDFVKGE